MHYDWIWKAILIITAGSLLLRLTGRTSIGKLTIVDVLLMLILGPLFIRPVENENIWTTFGTAIILILTLRIIRALLMRYAPIRALWIGKPISIIVNGELKLGAMKSLNLSDEELNAQLRTAGIFDRDDVEYAAIEAGGQLTIKPKPHKVPATKQDIEQLKQFIESRLPR
ncbi:DUF421 domain-containing protein [Paenibacillus roseipurpureus]|uniref:DUF421 domain-containing protein n=1 Tax=Paenibacillus roseopurpureus TaxID=2918901 RepID=A0AA96LN83_9BACL|nr:YetF domain-containing protein [Paenibacillus sp. MBLB1832]WNR44129.1 DUF421 domain-containing protein [Paenibacillus sp. MBLB1832]